MSGASRVAFVTGASSGIGQAATIALAGAGCRVVAGYSTNADGAALTVKEAQERSDAMSVRIDVADPNSVDAAFAEIEAAFGPPEILVNNAGITRDGLLLKMDDAQWNDVVRTNLDGAFYTIRRATPKMLRARWGRIVNIGSVAALAGSAGQVNYAAAKAGLVGLTRSVARELASRNITCNLVAPGPVATAMTDALSEQRRQEMATQVPLGRFGTLEEVAGVIAFVCSDLAGYVTGAVIPVDGGLGMGH